MKITIREKSLGGTKYSLFLNITDKGKRKKESLGLYIYRNPRTSEQRMENKESLRLAEEIRAKRLLQLTAARHGLEELYKPKIKFLDYYEQQKDKRNTSDGNSGQWESALHYLSSYPDSDIYLEDVDEQWLEGLKDPMLNSKKKRNVLEYLRHNSAHSYYNKVCARLNQAERELIIIHNPARNVTRIPALETWREYLTLDELKKVASVPCEVPVLKRATLFSALTGLRWSDIVKIQWKDIQHTKQDGYFLRYRQQKTKTAETKYLSQQAYYLLGEQTDLEFRPFRGLSKGMETNKKLLNWIREAGINKHITFHCFRYTYATLQLTLGTDIYILSKELGHKNLKNTEIYARIINVKKKEAAERMPELEIRM